MIQNAASVNKVQYTLMAIEGIVCSTLATCFIFFIVTKVGYVWEGVGCMKSAQGYTCVMGEHVLNAVHVCDGGAHVQGGACVCGVCL